MGSGSRVRGGEGDVPRVLTTRYQPAGNIGQTVGFPSPWTRPTLFASPGRSSKRAGPLHPDRTEPPTPITLVLNRLAALAKGGTPAPARVQDDLDEHIASVVVIDPATLKRPEALAYWLNLQNAGALNLAARAFAERVRSILGVPGGFDSPAFRKSRSVRLPRSSVVCMPGAVEMAVAAAVGPVVGVVEDHRPIVGGNEIDPVRLGEAVGREYLFRGA